MSDWWLKPVRVMLDGRRYDLYGIGHVARALGRSSSTVRRWEREAAIPKATFTLRGRDSRGDRRLYSRKQVNLLVESARAAGLFDLDGKNPSEDQIATFGALVLRDWTKVSTLTDADLTANAARRAQMIEDEKGILQ